MQLPAVPLEAAATVLALEPDDLDGYSVDDLADYLDAGMRPANPRIDSSPACLMALSALLRLRATAVDLLEEDAAAEPEPDKAWFEAVLTNIGLEARAGRSIPFRTDSAGTTGLHITEGAVRTAIRDAGDMVPGLLISRVRLDGAADIVDAPVLVRVEVTVLWGTHIPERVDTLRVGIGAALRRITELQISGIDVTVTDVLPPRRGANSSETP
jgi:hypothetical protein